jgi:hypothetical protein
LTQLQSNPTSAHLRMNDSSVDMGMSSVHELYATLKSI